MRIQEEWSINDRSVQMISVIDVARSSILAVIGVAWVTGLSGRRGANNRGDDSRLRGLWGTDGSCCCGGAILSRSDNGELEVRIGSGYPFPNYKLELT
jgi:hypothetical protein